MKCKTVRRYKAPRYPTKLEAQKEPDLLKSNLPRAWLLKTEVAGALSLSLLIGNGGGCGSALGCVAVIPPVYFSEEQALVIIKDEMAKYGVTLSDDPADIEAMNLPVDVDAVDKEKDIAVEFISIDECREQTDIDDDGYCDFESVVLSLTEQMASSNSGVSFRAFQDPEESEETYAEENLREQVQDFANWLKGQGII